LGCLFIIYQKHNGSVLYHCGSIPSRFIPKDMKVGNLSTQLSTQLESGDRWNTEAV